MLIGDRPAPVFFRDFETTRISIAHTIEGLIEREQDYESLVPGLTLFRRDKPQPPNPCFVETSIVVAVQGQKQMLSAGKAYPYSAAKFLVTSMAMPANSQVLEASAESPCLGLTLKLNMRTMADIIARGFIQLPCARPAGSFVSIGLGTLEYDLLYALMRMINLLQEPESIQFLAPLIEYEIHYHLLRSDVGRYLIQIAMVGSKERRIAKAIDWLREHYRQELHMGALTRHVQMSKSSLYQHFRELTDMTPLQYQKWLRLNEARRLMFEEGLNASSAAFMVGYQSPSHFSREYGTLFGLSPKRDIENLRSRFKK
ncbi:AraC family transcriptional regulator [Pantoea cypripedii]|nr:AraC family transcriptional regulator [Pantoea cypripedii]